MDPITKYLLNEGRFLSDQTLYADIGKFKDKKNRLLFIVGSPGAGKSTVSRKLSKIFKVKHYELDMFWNVIAKKYKYDSGDDPRKLFYVEVEKLITSIKGRAIIEGIDICWLWDKFIKQKYMMNSSFIVIGESAMKVGHRAGRGQDWSEYEDAFKMWDNWAKNNPHRLKTLIDIFKGKSLYKNLKIIANDLQKTNKDIVLKKGFPKDEKI